MSDEEFEEIVDKVTVYARVSPMDKLKIVRAWKNRGEVVAMTGDGVNDAPALKHADIGIAMGISGTDVAKEAADMVLGDDNFATIVRAIERGRWIYDNIKKYLTYLLRANITEVVVLGGVVIVAGPELLPLLPAAILYINLATDGLPALALGLSPPDRDIMQRPPRDPAESIFSRDVRLLVLLGVLIECPDLPVDLLRQLGRHRGRADKDLPAVRLRRADHFDVLPVAALQRVPGAPAQVAAARDGVGDRVARRADPVRRVRETFGIRMPAWSDIGMALAVSAFVVAAIEATKAYLRATTDATGTVSEPGAPSRTVAQQATRPPRGRRHAQVGRNVTGGKAMTGS